MAHNDAIVAADIQVLHIACLMLQAAESILHRVEHGAATVDQETAELVENSFTKKSLGCSMEDADNIGLV